MAVKIGGSAADNCAMRVWTDRRNRAQRAADAGFTLIEAVASLVIAALLLTAVAYATLGSLRGSTTARINQQAGDVLETTIEAARTAGISNLVMYTADPDLTTARDSRLLTSGCPSGGTMCVSVPNPTGSGTVTENLVTSPAPGFQTDHIQKTSTGDNNVTFTVSTYVTKPVDEANATYRHVTVFVTWTTYGKTHTRVDSTYVAATQRGLPLPSFKFTCWALQCVGPPLAGQVTPTPGQKAFPNAKVCFGFQITNLGFRDIFNLTADQPGWKFYHDLPDPDNLDPVTHQPVLGTCGTQPAPDNEDEVTSNLLADSDADNAADADTGTLENAASTTFWAIGNAPGTVCSTNPCTTPYTVNFTATSVVDPTLASSIHTLQGTIDVENTIVPGPVPPSPCVASSTAPQTGFPSGRGFYLHNTSNGTVATGNSATTNPLSFSTAVPTLTTLSNYSTDQTSNPSNPSGRFLQSQAATTTLPQFSSAATAAQLATMSADVNPGGNNKTFATWQFTVTANVKSSIAALSHFYLDLYTRQQPNENGNSPQTLTAFIGYKSNGSTFTPVAGNSILVNNGSSCLGTTGTGTAANPNMSDWRLDLPVPTAFTLKKNSVVELVVFNNSGTGNNKDLNLGYDNLGQTSPTTNLGPSVLYIPSSASLDSGSA